jgi:hypothetical protein
MEIVQSAEKDLESALEHVRQWNMQSIESGIFFDEGCPGTFTAFRTSDIFACKGMHREKAFPERQAEF